MLTITKEAQDKITEVSADLERCFGHDSHEKYALLGLIMLHAVRNNCLDEFADNNMVIYHDRECDFGFSLAYKNGVIIHGGINCHTQWFRNYMVAVSKNIITALKDAGLDPVKIPTVEWSINT